MEEQKIQKFKDLILDEHYCEDCNNLCCIGEAFPLEFVAKNIIKLEKEIKLLKDDYISISELNAKIKEIESEIEYQKQYGNVTTREKLEYKKEIYLELLEDK